MHNFSMLLTQKCLSMGLIDKSYECFILGKHTARNGVAGISPPRREFQKC